MTHGERIVRLTELARRRWPHADVQVALRGRMLGVWTGESLPRVSVIDDDLAYEALEAALLVLSSKYPGMMRLALADLSDRGKVSTAKVTLRSDKPPAWVEQLAAEWERGANARLVPEREAQWLRLCAAELRERAKGGT